MDLADDGVYGGTTTTTLTITLVVGCSVQSRTYDATLDGMQSATGGAGGGPAIGGAGGTPAAGGTTGGSGGKGVGGTGGATGGTGGTTGGAGGTGATHDAGVAAPLAAPSCGASAMSRSSGGTCPDRSWVQLQFCGAFEDLQTKFSSRASTQPTHPLLGAPAAFLGPNLQDSNAELFGHWPPGVNGLDSICVL